MRVHPDLHLGEFQLVVEGIDEIFGRLDHFVGAGYTELNEALERGFQRRAVFRNLRAIVVVLTGRHVRERAAGAFAEEFVLGFEILATESATGEQVGIRDEYFLAGANRL